MLSLKQKAAVRRAPPGAKAALRDQFGQQRKQPRNRRSQTFNLERMPSSRAYGKDHFENTKAKDLMKEAWALNPATSNLMAPRGLGYYDAFESHAGSAATHMSIGPCTPIDAKTTCGGYGNSGAGASSGFIDTGLSKDAMLLVVQPTCGPTQAVLHFIEDDPFNPGTLILSTQSYDSPQLLSDPPVDAIAIRQSIRVGNYTANINQGGLVRILRMTTGVIISPDFTSVTSFRDVIDGIREHRRTVTYRGQELAEDLQKNAIVADQSSALAFKPWQEIRTTDQVPWLWTPDPSTGVPVPPVPAVTVYPFTFELYNPSYTPIAILFEPFINVQQGPGSSLGNSYSVVVQSQFLAHYKQGTMLANLALTPSTNPTLLTRHTALEERVGSMLSRLGGNLGGLGQFAMHHRSELAGAARQHGMRQLVGSGLRAAGKASMLALM